MDRINTHPEGAAESQSDAPSGLEPTIEDLFDPLEPPLAFLRGDGDAVDRLTMKVAQVAAARELVELLDRADADLLYDERGSYLSCT